MNVDGRNRLLSEGCIDRDDLWPKIKEYENRRFQFRWEFGIDQLPTAGGVIVIRGPRQSGKSTWLELKLLDTVEEFGKGSGFFLNGDFVYSHEDFETKLLELETAFHKKSSVKRIFIDEITQISNWQRVVKRLIDSGHLKDVLIVTTGSNAADLRHGAERLPGRKGNLPRTEYIFLPISYKEYLYQTQKEIGVTESDVFWAYVLTGGSPLAINDFYYQERLSDVFSSLISDWAIGDIAASGRSRIFLLSILQKLFLIAPSSISYTKLAKDAGLANNTAALDYVERLANLLCVHPMMAWDHNKDVPLAKKPSKMPFINLGFAWTFHPLLPRYTHELRELEGQNKGAMFEWIVAQELWRREQLKLQTANVSGKQSVSSEVQLLYWTSKEHEIDFVTPSRDFFEVKAGQCSALDFAWFPKIFPKRHLTVISESKFETQWITGKHITDFLLEAPSELYYDSDRML